MSRKRSEMTAYGRVQADRRKMTNRKTASSRMQAAARGKCGAKKRNGEGVCQQRAGMGTTHPGIGRCKFHGGSTPASTASAAKEAAIQFMGAPKDINPLDAIIWCIRITAGEVEWLSQEIANITSKEEWIEHTVVGKQMHVLQRARSEAQDRLVKYSKDAISLGLAERAVRLAEQYGQTIAKLLEGIARDLTLDTDQKKRWPIIVRKHLILLEGGNVVETGDKDRPLLAIPKRAGGTGA